MNSLMNSRATALAPPVISYALPIRAPAAKTIKLPVIKLTNPVMKSVRSADSREIPPVRAMTTEASRAEMNTESPFMEQKISTASPERYQ